MNSVKKINLLLSILLVAVFLFPKNSFAITDPISYTNSSPGTISGGVVSAALGCTDAYDKIGNAVENLFSKEVKDRATGVIENAVPTKDGTVRSEIKEQTDKEKCKDAIAYAAAKVTLRAMTQNIINWIGSGFDGDSIFIKNPESFFKSIADQEVYSFVTELNNPDKYPWGPEIGESLSVAYEGGDFTETSIFTLDEEIGEDWEDFFEDFNVGGWDGWIAATQNPANNPVSFRQEASNALEDNIDNKLEQTNRELTWGNGFISLKKCVEYKDTSRPVVGGVSGTGGGVAVEEEYTLGGLEIDNCSRYEITTPGSAISDQLNLSLGSGIREAELADELNESIASIVDALTNQLIYEGVTAVQNATSDTEQTGGYGSNNGFYDGTFDTASGFTWDPYAPVDLGAVVPQDLERLNEYLGTLTEAKTFIETQMLPTLRTIDNLMPEPDYGYEERMQDLYDSRISAIYAESDYEKFQNVMDVFFSSITLGILSPLVEADDQQFAQRKAEAANAETENYQREIQRVAWDIQNHNLPSASIFREQRDKMGTYSDLLEAYKSTIAETTSLIGKLDYVTENLCDEAIEPDCDNTSLQYVYSTVVPYVPDDEALGTAIADYETFQVEKNYAESLIPVINTEKALVPFGAAVEPSVGPIWDINGSWGLVPPIKMPMTNGQYDDMSWEQKKAIDYADSLSATDLVGEYVNAAIFGAFDPDENIYVYAGVVYNSSGAANTAYNNNLSLVSANLISPLQNPYSLYYPLPNPSINPFLVYGISEGDETIIVSCVEYINCPVYSGQDIYSNFSSLAKSIYEDSDSEESELPRRISINPYAHAYNNPNY